MTPMWSDHELAQLPRDDVFSLRGYNVSRLETFVDAAFAFAVTLLVISIDNVPSDYDAFIAALLQTPAFLACFFQLLMFWLGHRAWSRRYGLETGIALWLSLFLVAGILIIVYPLKLMFSAGFSFMTNGFLPTPVEFSFEQLRVLFILYGAAFGFLSLVIACLFWTAFRQASSLNLSTRERYATKSEIVAWFMLAATGFISILIALLTTGIGVIAAGWIYMLLAVAMPLHGRYKRRQLGKLMG